MHAAGATAAALTVYKRRCKDSAKNINIKIKMWKVA